MSDVDRIVLTRKQFIGILDTVIKTWKDRGRIANAKNIFLAESAILCIRAMGETAFAEIFRWVFRFFRALEYENFKNSKEMGSYVLKKVRSSWLDTKEGFEKEIFG